MLLDVFVGQLKSALTCLTCGYVSNTFDPFLDLSLPIPKVSCDVCLLWWCSDWLLDELAAGSLSCKCLTFLCIKAVSEASQIDEIDQMKTCVCALYFTVLYVQLQLYDERFAPPSVATSWCHGREWSLEIGHLQWPARKRGIVCPSTSGHLKQSLSSRIVWRHISLNYHTNRSDNRLNVDRRPCSDSRHVTAPYKLSFIIIIIIIICGGEACCHNERHQSRCLGDGQLLKLFCVERASSASLRVMCVTPGVRLRVTCVTAGARSFDDWHVCNVQSSFQCDTFRVGTKISMIY